MEADKQEAFLGENGEVLRSRFGRKNYIRLLLNQAITLFGAESVGIVYGTDESEKKFLPANQWDRGILGHLAGRGPRGLVLRWFGPQLARLKKLIPILLYRTDEQGRRRNAEGIIAFVLRNYGAFYKTGINVLIVPDIDMQGRMAVNEFLRLDIFSYDGKKFSVPDAKLMTTVSIIRSFEAKNFLAVLIPDFGILVINTAENDLVHVEDGVFVREQELRSKLDALIHSIEVGSLAILFSLSGRQGSELLWRKELFLRKTAKELNAKEVALDLVERELLLQRAYLRAVGGVTEEQLNMDPAEVEDGVYAFLDMVKSATIRQYYNGEEYFFLTNVCRRIMALAASHFHCRIDNYIGDAIFIENVSIFDLEYETHHASAEERCAIILLMLLDIFYELRLLIQGTHPIDPQGRVSALLLREGQTMAYRAGVDVGHAIVGPIGTPERKIVTGLGKAVDNASRLESTGRPNAIHLSGELRGQVENLVISAGTRLVHDIITSLSPRPGRLFDNVRTRLLAGESLSFSNLYREMFPAMDPEAPACWLSPSVFVAVDGVSYKEYRPEHTFLLWPGAPPHQGGRTARAPQGT